MSNTNEGDSDLYFRQIPVGPMANFAYLIGSRTTRQCLVVDPAWDVPKLLELAQGDDMTVTGALVTHYHPDHVGGGMYGFEVPGGVTDLLTLAEAKIHVNKHEADGLKQVTGVGETDLVRHDGGDLITLGDVAIELIHTPGHTPGSQCFLVRERLVAGDTLFVDGCGRVDLPGADPEAMFRTLTETLGKLVDDVTLFPGHDYGSRPTSTMREQRKTNTYLKIRSLSDWMRLMGA
ncbi:MAG: MBL fold metallo-hydrolase [Deltaproteobacteria bacterium]|nr:MBL fold metallo-hydrolase [Deltaproteobacteria bacterium]